VNIRELMQRINSGKVEGLDMQDLFDRRERQDGP